MVERHTPEMTATSHPAVDNVLEDAGILKNGVGK
jgi:hypothetical protein